MGQNITPHIAGTKFDICVPTAEPTEATIASHKNGRCVYFADRNIALCPMGQVLYPTRYENTKGQAVFGNPKACKQCVCRCTKETRSRRYKVYMVKDDFSKEYNVDGLQVKQTRIFADSNIVKHRKSIVERPFGTIKRHMDAGYCLTKGLMNVTGEFSLTFLAYNIKRVINILGCKRLLDCMAALFTVPSPLNEFDFDF